MSTYKKPARIKDCSVQFIVPDGEALWPREKILLLVQELKQLNEEDLKRHIMDEHFSDLRDLIDEFVGGVQDAVDSDPTADFSGEPPLSAKEMANISFQQKLALKK
jgi:hypothetical protein